MIKVWIDDKRPAPEGWFQLWNIRDALRFLEENYKEVSHIAFDYYLSDDMIYHTSALLIRDLGHVIGGPELFHQPLENYTFHSSDKSKNDEMKALVMKFKGLK